MDGVVRGPDVMDCVLLVPDGVASIKVGRFTKWPAHDTIAGLSNEALNAALASIHGTSAVHDNIAAFHLPIPIYTGRPQWAHWPGPGPAPRFWFPGIGATAQDTWFDARGHVVRRTTTEIDLTVRVQVPRTASH
jgi:hypothetical protein